HPRQFLEAFVMFVIAAHVLGRRGVDVPFALLLCAVPALRGPFQGNEAIYLNEDIASVAVMAFPIAALGALSEAHIAIRLTFAVFAAEMLRILAVAQNRGAALGFACVLVVLWWNSGHRLRWAAAAVPLALVAVLLVPGKYVDRFRVLWNPAAKTETAAL